jgi:hypothetical protein
MQLDSIALSDKATQSEGHEFKSQVNSIEGQLERHH